MKIYELVKMANIVKIVKIGKIAAKRLLNFLNSAKKFFKKS